MIQLKMEKDLHSYFSQRKNGSLSKGQQVYEKIVHNTNHQRNTYQNGNCISPHST
jgi:hypothetical protein